MKFCYLISEQKGKSFRLFLTAIMFLAIFGLQSIHNGNLVHAETGQGADVFKVLMTIFGVDDTKGDVIALVTINDGQASKVKFLETDAFKPLASNMTSLTMTPIPDSSGGILEYVATFPNVTVNTGAGYKACVMTTKDLELLCKTGHNSPASRPEFADINLDEITAIGTEQIEAETEN